jgi:hypothetical protein
MAACQNQHIVNLLLVHRRRRASATWAAARSPIGCCTHPRNVGVNHFSDGHFLTRYSPT